MPSHAARPAVHSAAAATLPTAVSVPGADPRATTAAIPMHHLPLAVAVSASCLAAQGVFDLDRVTSGTLGTTLTIQARNATPNGVWLTMVSGTTGPTPVALLDPADPRVLSVGVDLLPLWSVGLLGPTGAATYSAALPNDPAVQGAVLYWQGATFSGAPTFLGQISNALTTHHTLVNTSAALPGALLAPAAAAVVAPTPNRNLGGGDFLVVNGGTNQFFASRRLAAEAGPALNTARTLFTAVRLNDGRLLVTGGVDALGAVIASCEVYNPATNAFTAVASMNNVRAGHAAVTLADGRVMVAGGTNNYVDLTTAVTNAINTVEIYNPATNAWTNAPALGGRRVVPALTLLSNGKVMVSGGVEVTLLFGIPVGVTSTNKTQLYTPSTNTWANGPAMPSGRAYHHESQVTLADGRVLMSGGVFVPDLINALNATSIAAADVYNPTTNTWVATTMSRQRTGHSATRLANGDVIVCGGAEGVVNSQIVINAVARFAPASNSWTDLPALVEPRAAHVARLLPDNSLVLLGPGTTSELLHF